MCGKNHSGKRIKFLCTRIIVNIKITPKEIILNLVTGMVQITLICLYAMIIFEFDLDIVVFFAKLLHTQVYVCVRERDG